MKFQKYEAEYNNKIYKIEEDYPNVGWYLYIFEGDKCVRDDLQNDFETCKQIAFEDFNVPLDRWVKK